MRLSVDMGDPGFWRRTELTDVKVTVGGVEQRACITADEERGEAFCVVLDDRGYIVPDPANPDQFKMQKVLGTVVIHMPAELRARIEAKRRA